MKKVKATNRELSTATPALRKLCEHVWEDVDLLLALAKAADIFEEALRPYTRARNMLLGKKVEENEAVGFVKQIEKLDETEVEIQWPEKAILTLDQIKQVKPTPNDIRALRKAGLIR